MQKIYVPSCCVMWSDRMAERGTKYASLARYLSKVIRKLVNTEFILNIYQNIMTRLKY